MKKIAIFIFCFILLVSVSAQQKIKFLGMDWGISKDEAIKQYPRKVDMLSNVNDLLFITDDFAGIRSNITLSFFNDQFCNASVYFFDDGKYIDKNEMFKFIFETLVKKYGDCTTEGKISKKWDFNEKGVIMLLYSKNVILLNYEDGIISKLKNKANKEEEARQKEKDKKDL